MSNNIVITKPISISLLNQYMDFQHLLKSNKYYFELFVVLKDNTTKTFRTINDKKYADLIDLKDNIIFSELKSYDLKVTQIPDNIDKVYSLSGQIADDKSCPFKILKIYILNFQKMI